MAEVLLRRSALGDVVLLGAVVGALDRPAVVTHPAWVPLVRRMTGVGEVVPWGGALPEGRLVDLQGDRRAAAILGGRPVAARIDKRPVARRLRLLGLGWGRPLVTQLYAEACGVLPVDPPWFELPAGRRDTLILIPGAASPIKRWPVARFRALAQRWEGPVVALGGPGEESMAEAVIAGLPAGEVIAGRGFDGALAALADGAVAVGGDTGLTHLAAACGVPVVTLFGPTHPDDGFAGHRGEVVQRALACRPCTLHRRQRCWRGDHACMDLALERVAEAMWRSAGS
ncbi:MAG: glycosyltransferase family 9 protein [Deltaproteobacteria bacterium]|nr:glycosyltransferase family 9 protein [Deltaproteobacteria bacterium]